jgi:multidrug resistance efflux pump
MHAKLKYLITGTIVLVAIGVFAIKYWDYITNPWTRDGQVRAQVIQITPRVSGPIVKLPIKDNQFVKAGDLLFEIDPRTFAADLEHARAELDDTRDNIEALGKQVEAAQANVQAAGATVKEAQSAIKDIPAGSWRPKRSTTARRQWINRGRHLNAPLRRPGPITCPM